MLAMKTAMLLASAVVQTEASPAAPSTGVIAPEQPTGMIAPERSPPVTSPPPAAPKTRANPAKTVPDRPNPDRPSLDRDVVVVGKRDAAGDPLIAVNARAFGATQAVDKAVVGPVSLAYKRGIPAPVRSGIHNFLYNLREPIVFVNFLLQFKVGKAAETAGRFVVNSTIGAVGVLDIAKRRPFRLPRRSNGFANTLGYHGVKNGPFLFLPLVGPTTVRDLLGGTIDRLLLPVAVGKPFTETSYTVPAGILGAMDHRAEFDETLKCLHDDSADPYSSSRAFYLQRRQAEIDHLRGRVRKETPRCETVGFGIGSTPPASTARTATLAETPPSVPVAAPGDVPSNAPPPAPPAPTSPAPTPPTPPTRPAPTSPTPTSPTSDIPDHPIAPPVTDARITDPG